VIARRVSSEAAMVERFDRAKAEGDLPASSDPKALAQCLTTLMGGLSVKAQGNACPNDLKGVVDAFLGMWPSP
jgi:hypothetical protein